MRPARVVKFRTLVFFYTRMNPLDSVALISKQRADEFLKGSKKTQRFWFELDSSGVKCL